MSSIGNDLDSFIQEVIHIVLRIGESIQLNHIAYNLVKSQIQEESTKEPINLQIPTGCKPDGTLFFGNKEYRKQELLDLYDHHGNVFIAMNDISFMVTIMESLFKDVTFRVIAEYPEKLPDNVSLPNKVLFANNLSKQDLEYYLISDFTSGLFYDSPKNYIKQISKFISIDLTQCPKIQQYYEIKASRDILVHNGGRANETYFKKAGSFARVNQVNESLPMTLEYFFYSYEICLQIIEWLGEEFHKKWSSENRNNRIREGLLKTVLEENTSLKEQLDQK